MITDRIANAKTIKIMEAFQMQKHYKLTTGLLVCILSVGLEAAELRLDLPRSHSDQLTTGNPTIDRMITEGNKFQVLIEKPWEVQEKVDAGAKLLDCKGLKTEAAWKSKGLKVGDYVYSSILDRSILFKCISIDPLRFAIVWETVFGKYPGIKAAKASPKLLEWRISPRYPSNQLPCYSSIDFSNINSVLVLPEVTDRVFVPIRPPFNEGNPVLLEVPGARIAGGKVNLTSGVCREGSLDGGMLTVGQGGHEAPVDVLTSRPKFAPASTPLLPPKPLQAAIPRANLLDSSCPVRCAIPQATAESGGWAGRSGSAESSLERALSLLCSPPAMGDSAERVPAYSEVKDMIDAGKGLQVLIEGPSQVKKNLYGEARLVDCSNLKTNAQWISKGLKVGDYVYSNNFNINVLFKCISDGPLRFGVVWGTLFGVVFGQNKYENDGRLLDWRISDRLRVKTMGFGLTYSGCYDINSVWRFCDGMMVDNVYVLINLPFDDDKLVLLRAPYLRVTSEEGQYTVHGPGAEKLPFHRKGAPFYQGLLGSILYQRGRDEGGRLIKPQDSDEPACYMLNHCKFKSVEPDPNEGWRTGDEEVDKMLDSGEDLPVLAVAPWMVNEQLSRGARLIDCTGFKTNADWEAKELKVGDYVYRRTLERNSVLFRCISTDPLRFALVWGTVIFSSDSSKRDKMLSELIFSCRVHSENEIGHDSYSRLRTQNEHESLIGLNGFVLYDKRNIYKKSKFGKFCIDILPPFSNRRVLFKVPNVTIRLEEVEVGGDRSGGISQYLVLDGPGIGNLHHKYLKSETCVQVGKDHGGVVRLICTLVEKPMT